MTRRRKIVGHVILNVIQQQKLRPGKTIDLPLEVFRRTVKWAARVGDLVWVKEPFWMLEPQAVVIPGHLTDRIDDLVPEFARKAGYRRKWHGDGADLRRIESRFTLEISGFLTGTGMIRFLAHACQIDAFAKARAA